MYLTLKNKKQILTRWANISTVYYFNTAKNMISVQKTYMYSSGAVFWTVFSSINVQDFKIAMYSPDKLLTVG